MRGEGPKALRTSHRCAVLLCVGLLLSACGTSAPRLSDRQIKAQAMFAERCKTAGERILKTVENVEGIYLLKIRPIAVNFDDQFRMDDPYGKDSGGIGYVQTFLRGSYRANRSGTPSPGSRPPPLGYDYVEALDSEDGKRYRYTGRIEEPWQHNKAYLKGYMRFAVNKTLTEETPSRYGVTYDDISTHEEREYWIAGSSLKVIDLHSNEVIAERVGYLMDWAQGSQAGGRSPWLWALDNACPTFRPNGLPGPAFSSTSYQTTRFVEKVLQPASR